MRLRRQDVETLLSRSTSRVRDGGRRRSPQAPDECQRAESVVSYLRRVIQGELDLVIAEMELRASGARGDVERLVQELPAILGASRIGLGVAVAGGGDGTGSTSRAAVGPGVAGERGRHPRRFSSGTASTASSPRPTGASRAPGRQSGHIHRPRTGRACRRMRDDEASLSAQRRQLHERIDLLQDAIIERYKSGAPMSTHSCLRATGPSRFEPG